MSANKWTPGPWTLATVTTSCGSCHKIGPFPSLGVYDKTHACVYADNVRIGIDDKGGGSKIGDELFANARLIAAAPELFEALEELVSRCDGEEGVRADGSNIQTMRANALLARIEGDA